MSTAILFTIVVAVLLATMATGMRVALSLTCAGLVGLYLLSGPSVAFSTLAAVPIASGSRYTLLVIPMFILLGTAAQRANLAEGAFELLGWLLRRIPGGLALATLAACAAFAAVSGSSIATVVAIGNMAISQMVRAGYAMHVAVGVVGSAGTLGILIPPSVPLVLYGVLTGESIGALLMAGIGPGVLTAVVYGIGIMVRARRHPELFGKAENVLPLADRPRMGQGIHSLVRMSVLFLIVIGGMYSGFFTAIEASAVGALVALLMVAVEYWRRPREAGKNLWASLCESISLSGMVFVLLVGGAIFSTFMVAAGAPQLISDALGGLSVPPWAIVALILLVLIPLGMVLEPMTMLVVMVPLTYPLVTELGVNGIWFGLLFIKLCEIGLLTPPLGINAFVVAGLRPDISVTTAFKGVLWYVRLDIVIVILMFLFPSIVLFLPRTMGLAV